MSRKVVAKKMVGLARAKGQQIPTFEFAPEEMLPENLIGFKMRMQQLDLDHSRARSPEARMRIEGKMRELRTELRKLEKAEADLNAAAKRWWDETQAALTEVLGPDSTKH